MNTIHFVTSEEGDWIALYVNGCLRCENHSLNEQMVAREIVKGLGLDIQVTSEEKDLEWWETHYNHDTWPVEEK